MKKRSSQSGGILGLLRRLGWIRLALLGTLALALAYGVRRWRRYEPHIEVGLAADFRLGYNLDFPGDWTNLPPFIDQVKNARGFEGGCAEGESECHPTRHLDLDAQGWVKSMRFRDDPARSYQRVELIFNSSKERHDIGKPFVVTWRGQGEIEVRGARDAQYDAERKRITFTLPPELVLLRITAIDPAQTGDYLREIRVFRAEHEALLGEGKVFDPDMLRFLAPFRSLRFMDWMQTNSAGRCSGGDQEGEDCYAVSNEACGEGVCVMAGKWSERPRADQAIWIHTGQFLDNAAPERGTKLGGYPIETLVALANELRAAPHFNLPAHADEEYTRELASYLKQHLDPTLPASVEYSNEVWNWKFPQADYAKARAAELWPGVGTGWVQYGAVRTHQMCRVFREVFAGQEWRVRCLISPQTGWRGLAPEVLDCPSWTAQHPEDESCTKYVDAINIAGYFGGCMPSQSGVIAGWLREGREAALTKAFEHLNQGGGIDACSEEEDDSVAQAIDSYRHYMQLAARRGLGLEVYEGGTHFEYSAEGEGGSEEIAQFFVDVARDPRMREVYLRNYDGFRAAGGSTFNVWGWIAPNDAWANVDSPVALEHPKYRAITEFAERVAPRTPR